MEVVISHFLSFQEYIYRVGRVWVQLLRGQGTRARVILVVRECNWNAPAASLVLLVFDNIGPLGSPPSQIVYPLG